LAPTRRTLDELAAEITALEVALGEAVAQLQGAEERAAALAEEKAEVDGRAKLARQAVTDFEQRIAQQREAFAAAEEFEQACQAVDALTRQRDLAAGRLAAAARELMERLDELASLRSEVEAATEELHRRYGRSVADVPRAPAEPPELLEAWHALRERLEAERNLDEALLEAAASSRFVGAVDKLPQHLQEAGRRRWMERRRELRQL
jgi:predicted  nucleic acid-binding Zn-ribbon protein